MPIYFTAKDYDKHNSTINILKEREKIVWAPEKIPAMVPRIRDKNDEELLLESNTLFSASTFFPKENSKSSFSSCNIPIPDNTSAISTDNILNALKWTCEDTQSVGNSFVSAVVYTNELKHKTIAVATLGSIGALLIRVRGSEVFVVELNRPDKNFSYTTYQMSEQQQGDQDFLVLESNHIVNHFNPATWKKYLQDMIAYKHLDEAYVNPEMSTSKLCSAVAITVKKIDKIQGVPDYVSMTVIDINKALTPNHILMATHSFAYEASDFSSRMANNLQAVFKPDFQIQRSLANFLDTLQLISENKNYGFSVNIPMFDIATKLYFPFNHSEDKDTALIQLRSYAENSDPCQAYADIDNYLNSNTRQATALKETNIQGQLVSNTFLKIQEAAQDLRKSLEISANRSQFGPLNKLWMNCFSQDFEAIEQRVFTPNLSEIKSAKRPSYSLNGVEHQYTYGKKLLRLTKWGTPYWTIDKLLDELEKRWDTSVYGSNMSAFISEERNVLMNYILAKSKSVTNLHTITRIALNIIKLIDFPSPVTKKDYFCKYNFQVMGLLEGFINEHPELKENSMLQKNILFFKTQMYKNELPIDFNLNKELVLHYARLKKCRQYYIQLKQESLACKKLPENKDSINNVLYMRSHIKTLIYSYAHLPFEATSDSYKIDHIEANLEDLNKCLKTLKH